MFGLSKLEVCFPLQWDLVCERNFLAELSQSAYQLVALFGEIIMAWLIDKVGRKKMHIAGKDNYLPRIVFVLCVCVCVCVCVC